MRKKQDFSKANLVDNDDAPELTQAWFAAANMYRKGALVRRGRLLQATTKVAVKLRLDRDVVAAFKVDGPGWQTRINRALREWLVSHPGEQGDATNRSRQARDYEQLLDRIEDLEDELRVKERGNGPFIEASPDDL